LVGIKALANVVKLEATEPAVVELATCYFVEKIAKTGMHFVDSVAALQHGEINGMATRALYVTYVLQVEA
jgi:hypothetical protein